MTDPSPSAPLHVRNYGWRLDNLDRRDHVYTPALAARRLPTTFDQRPRFGPVYDQESLGACTAHAWGAAWNFALRKLGLTAFELSRLGLYYDERVLERTVRSDAGAQIRTGIKVLAKTGAAPERLWHYDVARFAERPPAPYYAEAKKHLAITYANVRQTSYALRACLAEDWPVVFGFTVYESFESDQVARTGIVPMPEAGEQRLGGHAVVVVGYEPGFFLVRNSWSRDWALEGYCKMPEAYVLNHQLAANFRTLRAVSA